MLEIPQGFERNLVREGSQQLNMSVDAINGTKSAIGSGYLTAVLTDFNRSLDVNTKSTQSRNAGRSTRQRSTANHYRYHLFGLVQSPQGIQILYGARHIGITAYADRRLYGGTEYCQGKRNRHD